MSYINTAAANHPTYFFTTGVTTVQAVPNSNVPNPFIIPVISKYPATMPIVQWSHVGILLPLI